MPVVQKIDFRRRRERPTSDVAELDPTGAAPSTSEVNERRHPTIGASLGRKTREFARRWSSRIARRNLVLLAARGNIAETLGDVPEKMHKVARQTRLVIEFVDDFRTGGYRDVPWWAVAVAATAMLYAINPADVVPNVLPIVGTLDDLAVVAVAVRLLEGQLRKYCRFKGYAIDEYF